MGRHCRRHRFGAHRGRQRHRRCATACAATACTPAAERGGLEARIRWKLGGSRRRTATRQSAGHAARRRSASGWGSAARRCSATRRRAAGGLLPRGLLGRHRLGCRRGSPGGLLGSAAAARAGLLGRTVSRGLLRLTRIAGITVARDGLDRRCSCRRFRYPKQSLPRHVGTVADEDLLRLTEQLRVLLLRDVQSDAVLVLDGLLHRRFGLLDLLRRSDARPPTYPARSRGPRPDPPGTRTGRRSCSTTPGADARHRPPTRPPAVPVTPARENRLSRQTVRETPCLVGVCAHRT